eukprot:5384261-Prorocentrum_lima.AAC.1
MTSSLVGFGDVYKRQHERGDDRPSTTQPAGNNRHRQRNKQPSHIRAKDCLLYTSDAADDM